MSGSFGDQILHGKNAYVAGGTRGMNLAIAKRYAEQGANVAVMSRNQERCANAAAEIEALGVRALGLPADARDYDAVHATMKQASEAFGGLDIVVAGQAGNFYAPATGMSSKGFRTVIDIDLIGTFNVFRASYEFLNKPGASLLAITAPEAVRPLHFQSHVCAAKAGVNMLCKCLALEWGPAGVRVNGLSPGPIEDSWGMMNVVSPSQAMRDKITRAMPLRRWGTCDDIASSALFLASDAASYITGTILETDGGAAIALPEDADGEAALNPNAR
jgi:NAD(P)-dependent dehydrogenase (short-subunit alcohol dehydrogenase family)